MPWRSRILIIGAGDTGTVSAIRLFKSGFRPIMLEISHPSDLHYNRNFSDVVYQGKKIIDDVETVKIYPDQDDQEIAQVINTTCANRQDLKDCSATTTKDSTPFRLPMPFP